MNDEFPIIIIERYQTCSILMLSVTSALHHVPLFMDRICLLLVSVKTTVALQLLQSKYVMIQWAGQTGVCRINCDGSSANVTLFSSRKIFLLWKVFGWLRQSCKSDRGFLVGPDSGLRLSNRFGPAYKIFCNNGHLSPVTIKQLSW